MTNDNQPQPDGFPRQPVQRPAPRQPGQPAGTPPTTGPLPMGPPPGSAPSGVPAQTPAAAPGQPAVPTYQPAPGVPVEQPNQPNLAGQLGVTPPIAPALGAVEAKPREDRGTRAPSLLPFAIAAGVCLLLAAIGLLAFLATRGDDEGKEGRQTATTQAEKSSVGRTQVIRTRPRRQTYARRTVEDVESGLGQVEMAIDEDEVLATAADPDGLQGDSVARVDGRTGGLVMENDSNAFDGELPNVDDLNLDSTGDSSDPMEPEQGTEEDTGDEEEEPENHPDTFAGFPDRVDLPKLTGSAGSASPTTLGALQLLESDDVSFGLRHGESAYGPRGRFAMGPTDESRMAQATLQLAAGQPEPVAEVSVDNNELKFQWLADDTTREADCLRNCSLLVTVGQQSRAMALRKPEVIAPWKVDPLKGGGTYERKLASVPKSASVGVEILELSERFPAHTIVGGARLQPSKWTPIKMQGSSKAELFTLDVRFRPTKTEEFSLEAKTSWPEGAKFNPRTIRTQVAGLQTRKNQLGSLPAARRAAVQQQIDAIDAQITRYQELQDACDKMAGGAEIHFRVFMNFGGLETDLFTSKAQATGTADSPTVFSGLEEAAKELDAKDADEG